MAEMIYMLSPHGKRPLVGAGKFGPEYQYGG